MNHIRIYIYKDKNRGGKLEEELLKELVQKPNIGLAHIMDQYMSLLYAVVQKEAGYKISPEDTQDIVSEAFLAIYQNRERINLDAGSLKNYLCAIAKRKTIDNYRREKIREQKEMISGYNTTQMESYLEKEEFLTYLESLNEEEQEIFLLKYYHDEKTIDIAKKLNKKQNTIDKKIQRGLLKLKKVLGGENNE